MFNTQEGMLRKSKQEFVRERLEKKISIYKGLLINATSVRDTIQNELETMERELGRWN